MTTQTNTQTTNPTLGHLTLQSLNNYRSAASQAVVAYRLGSHRLVSVVNGALKDSVYPRTAQLSLRATNRMNEVRGNVSDIVVKGIDQAAARADQVIALGSSTAAAQVAKIAELAAGVRNDTVANGLQAAVRLGMPGANIALVVSSRVAQGAQALAKAAGARAPHQVSRSAATTAKRKLAPVARKARAVVKAVQKAAPQAAAKAAVKAVTKAVTKAAPKAAPKRVAKAGQSAR